MAERSEEWMAGYEVGYREGESSRDADYFFALDDLLRGVVPEWDEDAGISPGRVVEIVRGILDSAASNVR